MAKLSVTVPVDVFLRAEVLHLRSRTGASLDQIIGSLVRLYCWALPSTDSGELACSPESAALASGIDQTFIQAAEGLLWERTESGIRLLHLDVYGKMWGLRKIDRQRKAARQHQKRSKLDQTASTGPVSTEFPRNFHGISTEIPSPAPPLSPPDPSPSLITFCCAESDRSFKCGDEVKSISVRDTDSNLVSANESSFDVDLVTDSGAAATKQHEQTGRSAAVADAGMGTPQDASQRPKSTGQRPQNHGHASLGTYEPQKWPITQDSGLSSDIPPSGGDTGDLLGASCTIPRNFQGSSVEVPWNFRGSSTEKSRKQLRYSREFERFWAHYPRKTAKLAAQKAYEKAVARIQEQCLLEGDPHEFLLKAVKSFAQSEAGQSGKFVPHASTWLNQGRYDDELQTIQPKKRQASASEILKRVKRNEPSD